LTIQEVQAKHGRFAVDTRDAYVSACLIESGEYSEEELQLLATCIRPGSDALVVGAHIGTLAIPLSRKCRELVAIEANPYTFDLLLRNVKLNERHNIATVQVAASDIPGELEFLCGTHNSGGSKRAPLKANPDYFYDNPEVVRVPAARLDDICAGRKFDLIHMDIEGSEVFALAGAQTLLPHAKYLSVEFIGHHLTDVAGVTVEEWLAPIRPHFGLMLVPGSTEHKRPHIFLEPADWHEMLQNVVDAGAGIEEVIFFNA
jgi:FkbM family methyltransferase